MDTVNLKAWIGRTETIDDVAAQAPLYGLAATLDYAAPPWPKGVLPPLAHWLHFLPRARQSDMDHDGHPKRGGFLPPITLPRRMWAGSRITFHAPIPIGAKIEKRSRIADVVEKSGATGPLIFVHLHHEIFVEGKLAVTDEQDAVYRDAPPKAAPAPRAAAVPPPAGNVRTVHPDIVQLFRYSAITFNGHRIHYDRDHAREEGYPGLVVHGPLTATFLMDHFQRHRPDARVAKLDIRMKAPLFDTDPYHLVLVETPTGADLSAVNHAGQLCATAKLDVTK